MRKRVIGFSLCPLHFALSFWALCSLRFAFPLRRSSRRKSPELGIYRRKTRLMSPPVPRGFAWHFATWAT